MKSRLSRLSQTPTWVVTLAVALAAAAYVLLIFLPFQKSIANLQQQLHDKHLQVMQADQLLLPLASETQRLAEIRQHTQQWERHAPGPQELAAFYARMSEQANRAGVPLLKFEPQPPRTLQTLRQYSVVLSVQGDFERLFELLTRIEKLPQTVWPTRLRLAQPEGGGASLQCEMTLTIFGDLAGSAD
ncbi:MAG TPA: type 4a pilus biogenesis protein PilO [Pirellulaceae bacterium]|nr:type 4a pilus biogenesis protein PilO [Pirellulaceae bacterium]